MYCPIFCAIAMAPICLGAAEPPRDPAVIESTTRLQVFLDRAGFGPGKIDGRFGYFTHKAANLYLQSMGQDPAYDETGAQTALRDQISSINTPFIDYTVIQEDLDRIGNLPGSKREQAKQKWLGYQSVAEKVAERFHADEKFFEELNPGQSQELKPGTVLKVPNVEPFEIAAVEQQKKQLAEESARASKESEKLKDKEESPPAVAEAPTHSIQIGTSEGMLKLFEQDKLVAAFPVTCGSAQIPSPIGEWKVDRIHLLPIFRYDKEMLQRGKRGPNAVKLPPGPNSPVGIVWIALNKEGIGIHGTDDPATIGRAVSHGCIRLSNWDAIRLANMVEKGTPVTITP